MGLIPGAHSGFYDSPEEFHHDIGNLFKACFAYNPEGNAIHDLGAQLLAEYQAMMEREPEVCSSPWLGLGQFDQYPYLGSIAARPRTYVCRSLLSCPWLSPADCMVLATPDMCPVGNSSLPPSFTIRR